MASVVLEGEVTHFLDVETEEDVDLVALLVVMLVGAGMREACMINIIVLTGEDVVVDEDGDDLITEEALVIEVEAEAIAEVLTWFELGAVAVAVAVAVVGVGVGVGVVGVGVEAEAGAGHVVVAAATAVVLVEGGAEAIAMAAAVEAVVTAMSGRMLQSGHLILLLLPTNITCNRRMLRSEHLILLLLPTNRT